jgi:ribosomal protein S27E
MTHAGTTIIDLEHVVQKRDPVCFMCSRVKSVHHPTEGWCPGKLTPWTFIKFTQRTGKSRIVSFFAGVLVLDCGHTIKSPMNFSASSFEVDCSACKEEAGA